MINNIYYTPINFTGKSYSRKTLEECEEFTVKVGKKFKKLSEENYVAYYMQKNNALSRDMFGYKVSVGSEALKPYTGTMAKEAGLSTESGGYGGGWIKAGVDTPLSTKDVHTCALLNLVNESTNEQLLYHVYSNTDSNTISKFIKEKFPEFTRANIMPGDQYQTNSTVNNILDALTETNRKATRHYYHMPVENPEVVCVNGKLSYIDNKHPDKMTFKEVAQYVY